MCVIQSKLSMATCWNDILPFFFGPSTIDFFPGDASGCGGSMMLGSRGGLAKLVPRCASEKSAILFTGEDILGRAVCCVRVSENDSLRSYFEAAQVRLFVHSWNVRKLRRRK